MSGTDAIVNLVKSIFSEVPELCNVTKKDLLHPTPAFARQLFYEFLRELGFSERIFSPGAWPKYGVLEDYCKFELRVITASMQKVLRDINYRDYFFGISDLLEPNSKRLCAFTGALVNYWLFCNEHYGSVMHKLDEAEMYIAKYCKMKENIESSKLKIETLRKKSQEKAMEVEKLAEDLEKAEQESGELLRLTNTVKDKSAAIKSQLSEAKAKEASLMAESESLEASIKKLRTQLKFEEGKEDMEAELVNLRLEGEAKSSDVMELRMKVVDLKALLQSYEYYLTSLEGLSELSQKCKEKIEMAKQKQTDLTELQDSATSAEDNLARLKSELEAHKLQTAKMLRAWKLRKGCLETDLRDYEVALDGGKKELSEQEITELDLVKVIEETKFKIERIEKAMEEERTLTHEDCEKEFAAYKSFKQGVQELGEKIIHSRYLKISKNGI